MSLPLASLVEQLKADYRRFPDDQSFHLYAEDVYFKDPMNEFRGCDRYRQMIGFIQAWFSDPTLDLHDIQAGDRHIRTEWTLSWTTPLPWKPRISIPGWSELEVNEDGLISSHIDYWHCSRLDVLKQHVFPTTSPEKR
ncbi:MAG: DUF2358 domain-containing protein [Synechococcales cyanobacterium T60_A2020_003]|nr:DUF2358 domain-containing protein [Synechococcales cyanobacterium T60_A2020_003]